jgi:hypothetical protein
MKRIHTLKTKRKISKTCRKLAIKNKWHLRFGTQGFKGKHHSKKTKKKLSIVCRKIAKKLKYGKWMKGKQSNSKGHKMTENSKEKLRK